MTIGWKSFRKYNLIMNKIYRKEWYIDRFFSLADYAKEIRLTDISSNMMDEYHKNKDEEHVEIYAGQPIKKLSIP